MYFGEVVLSGIGFHFSNSFFNSLIFANDNYTLSGSKQRRGVPVGNIIGRKGCAGKCGSSAVWIMQKEMTVDMELSCDQRVTKVIDHVIFLSDNPLRNKTDKAEK